jgi:hypothetical protein
MIRTKTVRRLACAAVLAGLGCITQGVKADYRLQLIANSQSSVAGGAEIASFDSSTGRFFSTHNTGVEYWQFDGSSISAPTNISFASAFNDLGNTVFSVSGVYADPLGRGFAAATLIPSNGNNAGRVVLFDTATGSVLKTLDVGFHPDMVTITADGSTLLVANEGERNPGGTQPAVNQAGSISRVDVSGVVGGNLAATTAGLSASTFDFSAANHANVGVATQLNATRRATGENAEIMVEPEYITVSNGKAYVSLQESNAVGVFDLASNKWESIQNLGYITKTIDASDSDGGKNVNDSMRMIFMPDAIASYIVNGQTYYLTANEGDARTDDTDVRRFGNAGYVVDPATLAVLNPLYGGNAKANAALGRLNMSLLDGNTDGDAEFEIPTAFGARGFSIRDANGNLIWDSGSDFENLTPAGDWVDSRSDDKGPEPEGIAVLNFDGRTLVAIGNERTNSLMLYDVTNPNSPFFLQYLKTGLGTAPEGLSFFKFNGKDFLLVSYEGTNTLEVFAIVPSPAAAVFGLGGFTALALRRGRSRR